MPEQENTNLNLNENQGSNPETSNQDYIEAIQELKKNSVSKDEYNKLQEEKNKLFKALIDGGQINSEVAEEINVDEVKKIITDENTNNLEFAKAVLALRKAKIDAGEQDPFLPYGNQVQITADDKKAADRVAQVFQECIDFADGDSEIFTMELARRTVDVNPKAKKLF